MSKHTAEVIIIGGGVNGCAAAYYLAKAGMKDVIVLEGSPSIGHGGSSRNGGGVRQSGRDVRELPYAMYAVQNMWPTLSEELGVDVEYYQKGNLRLGKTDAHMEKLRNLAANANSLGLDMKIIDGKEVKEICPYLSDEIIGASWCPTDGHANPMLTTLAYYKSATAVSYTHLDVYKRQVVDCSCSTYVLYLLELKNVNSPKHLIISDIHEKFKNTISDFLSDRFKEIFMNDKYKYEDIKLYLVSDAYSEGGKYKDYEQYKKCVSKIYGRDTLKVDHNLGGQLFRFRNRVLKIEYDIPPNPIIRKIC